MASLQKKGKVLVGLLFALSFLAAFVLMIRSSLNSAATMRGMDVELQTLYPDKPAQNQTLASTLAAKPYTVINFWASWCPPCIEEAPYLRRLYEAQPTDSPHIQYVAIASSDDRYAALQSEKYGMSSYIQLIDSYGSEISRLNNVNQLPQTFFVDSKGKVLLRLKGMMSASRAKTWQRAIAHRLKSLPQP